MKRYQLKIILFLFTILILSGCSDLLDIDPNDSITRKDMYLEDKDAFAIKSGLYNTLQSLVEQRFVLGELRGDLVSPARGAKNNLDVYEFMDHYVTDNNKYLDWSGFYKLINQCNDALVTLPKIKQNKAAIDSNFYNHIIGEVLWLRAWSYFTLVLNWGNVPFYTEPIYNVNDIKAKMPADENTILDQLEKDLIWASKKVYVNWAWGDTRIDQMWNHETVNQCAVIALLGDILVYRGKFEEAWSQSVYLKILTDQVVVPGDMSMQENWHSSFNINGGSLDGGRLWFEAQFRYTNEMHPWASWTEQGLVLAFDTEDVSGGGRYNESHTLGNFTNNRPEEGGWYYVKPSKSAVEMFIKNHETYRGAGYSYYIDDNTTLQTKDTLIWKYIGINAKGERRVPFTTFGNINIIRTSHLYLKAAEVANRLGYATEAISILNQNRLRVSAAPANVQADASVEEIEDAILEELATELAFEGDRWYDLVRIAKRRNNPDFLINKILANTPDSQKETVRARLELQSLDDWKLPYSAKAKLLNPYLQ